MREPVTAAINKLGVSLILRKGAETKKGRGIILPETYKKDKKTDHKGGCRSETHDFILYAKTDFLEGAERGDTVSDDKNEYYILWTIAYKCRCGEYMSAALRKTGGKNNGQC